jgi:hypothetical protein
MKQMGLWKKLLILIVLLPLILFGTHNVVLYWKQDLIVQQLINSANQDFAGKL